MQLSQPLGRCATEKEAALADGPLANRRNDVPGTPGAVAGTVTDEDLARVLELAPVAAGLLVAQEPMRRIGGHDLVSYPQVGIVWHVPKLTVVSRRAASI